MQIELMYFDGCHSREGALENLKVALNIEMLRDKLRVASQW
jgi:hypothetical protein